MKTGIHPIDIEELERTKQPWDLNYVASVLVELYNREHGTNLEVKGLTPKKKAAG